MNKMMMVVTCDLNFLCEIKTMNVMEFVMNPIINMTMHTYPAVSKVLESIISYV